MQAFANVTFHDLDVLALPAKHNRPKFYNGYVAKILSLFLTKFDQVKCFTCCPMLSINSPARQCSVKFRVNKLRRLKNMHFEGSRVGYRY